ncbi:MAG: hypothetical protein U5J95_05385 [Balneolaceae bacterium]|nr:hypothetical protein [Balneolaceae bacterium]
MAKPKNMAASVHRRLLNQSKDTRRPFMELLQYYAIKQTFKRRKTALPVKPPTALTDKFYNNEDKLVQWNAYRNKVSDFESPETLKEAVLHIRELIWPVNAMLVNKKVDKHL